MEPLTQDPFGAPEVARRDQGFCVIPRQFQALICAGDPPLGETEERVEFSGGSGSLPLGEVVTSCQKARRKLRPEITRSARQVTCADRKITDLFGADPVSPCGEQDLTPERKATRQTRHATTALERALDALEILKRSVKIVMLEMRTSTA